MFTPVAPVKPELERISVELFSKPLRGPTLSSLLISGQRPISLLHHSALSGKSLRTLKREREDLVVKEDEEEVEEVAEEVIEEVAEEEAAQEAAEEDLDHQEVAHEPSNHLHDAYPTKLVCF
jgi:hypothetical protein